MSLYDKGLAAAGSRSAITTEMRDAVPAPLYSCADQNCAAEVSFPADDLAWLPSKGGFYCTAPLECCWNFHATEDDGHKYRPSLATVLNNGLRPGT